MSPVFRVARREDYRELARWIVGISSAPEQHCLHSWSGESADVLCRQLWSYLAALELCYMIAFQDNVLVGAMGCEYDSELGRGWLHGPHATDENWAAIASQIFARLREELPGSITQLDAYLNIKNGRGHRFYEEVGYAGF